MELIAKHLSCQFLLLSAIVAAREAQSKHTDLRKVMPTLILSNGIGFTIIELLVAIAGCAWCQSCVKSWMQ